MSLRWLILPLALLGPLLLAGCGSQGVDRVDVTWEVNPPPRWGLYPGYRQEIPCPKGAVYTVDLYMKGQAFTGGAVADVGSGLAFKPSAGSRDITVETPDRYTLVLTVRLPVEKGEPQRSQRVLRVEKKDDKIYFEFLKP
jgi:hypothetical protein